MQLQLLLFYTCRFSPPAQRFVFQRYPDFVTTSSVQSYVNFLSLHRLRSCRRSLAVGCSRYFRAVLGGRTMSVAVRTGIPCCRGPLPFMASDTPMLLMLLRFTDNQHDFPTTAPKKLHSRGAAFYSPSAALSEPTFCGTAEDSVKTALDTTALTTLPRVVQRNGHSYHGVVGR